MRIGIVIPAYNAAGLLPFTIESVLAQTETRWELTVVDDGSTDDTAAAARRYAARDPRIRVVAQRNTGVAGARNRGLDETGDEAAFVIFLDQDDLWQPDTLRRLRDALERSPDAVAAHGMVRRVDAAGGPVEAGRDILIPERRKVVRRGEGYEVVCCEPDEPTTFSALVYDGCFWTPGAALVRRAALEGLRFDPGYAPCDDHHMWLRLSLKGDIAFLPEVVIDWREHGGNASRRVDAIVHAMERIRFDLLHRPELNPEQRRQAYFVYYEMYQRRLELILQRHAQRYEEAVRGHKWTAAAGNRAAARWYALRLRYVRLFRRTCRDCGPLPPAIDELTDYEQ